MALAWPRVSTRSDHNGSFPGTCSKTGDVEWVNVQVGDRTIQFDPLLCKSCSSCKYRRCQDGSYAAWNSTPAIKDLSLGFRSTAATVVGFESGCHHAQALT